MHIRVHTIIDGLVVATSVTLACVATPTIIANTDFVGSSVVGVAIALSSAATLRLIARRIVNRVLPVPRMRGFELQERKLKHTFECFSNRTTRKEETQTTRRHPWNVGATFARIDNSLPALTVFYPCKAATADVCGAPWLPFTDVRYAHEIARYGGFPAWLANHQLDVTMPNVFKCSVPFVSPKCETMHVVIFSHGLAGHRHMYSSLLQSVVSNFGDANVAAFALEHRDGTACFARCDEQDKTGIVYKRPPRDEPEKGVEDPCLVFRRNQMETRLRDIDQVIQWIETGGLLQFMDSKCAYDQIKLHLIGHSFGAATVLEAGLRLLSPKTFHRQCFLGSIICFDLWAWPVKEEVAKLIDNCRAINNEVRFVFCDSEQWMRWKEHQQYMIGDLLPALVKIGSKVQYFHTPGTDHISASDMALLTPRFGRKKYVDQNSFDDRAAMREWCTVVLATIT